MLQALQSGADDLDAELLRLLTLFTGRIGDGRDSCRNAGLHLFLLVFHYFLNVDDRHVYGQFAGVVLLCDIQFDLFEIRVLRCP